MILFALVTTAFIFLAGYTFKVQADAIASLDCKLTRIEAELALVQEMRHDETPTLAEGWQENREAQK